MDGRIGYLRCRCHVMGEPASAGRLRERLEHVAHELLTSEYEAALAQALADDPAVYVIRRVDARLALVLDGGSGERQAARRIGQRMAGAAVRSIAREAQGDNLVRFDDQADYVAHFLTDLVNGQAWGRWYYGAFRAAQPLDMAEVIHTALADNLPHLPAIIAHLHRNRALDRMVNLVSLDERHWLWSQLRGETYRDRADVRSLLSITIEFVERLDLWRRRPEIDTLLNSILTSRPVHIDWRDQGGPANAILHILSLLAQQDYLALPAPMGDGFRSRLGHLVSEFDWIDSDHFVSGFLDLLNTPPQSKPALPLPIVRRLFTPRRRKLLAALQQITGEQRVVLDTSIPDSAENALRLYAALIAEHPEWTEDAMATATIQQLLEAWKQMRQDGSSRALQDVHAPADRARVRVEFVAGLGESAEALLLELERVSAAQHPSLGRRVETKGAGVALLLRALNDIRLLALIKAANYEVQPGLSAVVLALLLRCAGDDTVVDGHIDAGLQVLAGLATNDDASDAIDTVEQLRAAWAAVANPGAWQVAWLRPVVAQRLMQPAVMHVYGLEYGAQAALVVADESGSLWPFGRIVHSPADGAQAVAGWLAAWHNETGESPRIVADHDAFDVTSISGQTVRFVVDETDALATSHLAGRDRLQSALSALDGGALGRLDWDLALALSANTLLSLWARWLRQFAASTIPYLLTQFVRRSGHIELADETITVAMDSRPLDVVLDLAGYRAPLSGVPWLGDREVRFQIEGNT